MLWICSGKFLGWPAFRFEANVLNHTRDSRVLLCLISHPLASGTHVTAYRQCGELYGKHHVPGMGKGRVENCAPRDDGLQATEINISRIENQLSNSYGESLLNPWWNLIWDVGALIRGVDKLNHKKKRGGGRCTIVWSTHTLEMSSLWFCAP